VERPARDAHERSRHPPDLPAAAASRVQVIDTARAVVVAGFASGDQPHESNYSAGGERIYHASIGSVYTPLDAAALDALKDRRYFQVIDARTYAILSRINVGKALADAG